MRGNAVTSGLRPSRSGLLSSTCCVFSLLVRPGPSRDQSCSLSSRKPAIMARRQTRIGRWTRDQKIALVSTVIGAVACIITGITVPMSVVTPEVRYLLGLEADLPGATSLSQGQLPMDSEDTQSAGTDISEGQYAMPTASVTSTVDSGGGPGKVWPLRIGAIALVIADGDGLHLRTGPGLNFRVLRLLPDGTAVQIIGGPIESNAGTWWEIKTLYHQEIGWVFSQYIEAVSP